jgi:hypothetical protein
MPRTAGYSLRRSRLVTVLKLFATALGAHLAKQEMNTVCLAIDLDELGVPGEAQPANEFIEATEHGGGEALASLFRDEHEVITKREAAVVELVDSHGEAQ